MQARIVGPTATRRGARRIQGIDAHVQAAVHDRPFRARPIAVDLDAVAVRIAEIDRFADAVIRRTLKRRARVHQPAQRRARCARDGTRTAK